MKKQVLICLLLISAMLLSCAGCAAQPVTNPEKPDPTQPAAAKTASVDLMAAIVPNRSAPQPVSQEAAAAAADFAIRLFRAGSESGKNTLLSPLSVLCALAMTANGAKGETLAQMEQTLGLDRDALNAYVRAYLDALENDKTLKLANSIWFTADERFTVNEDFLQTNADYYGADIRKAPFDEGTLAEINDWVKRKTDGMIPSILDKIPREAVMYLVNALAFDAKWAKPYEKYSVSSGNFSLENGEKRLTDFMYSTERLYLEDDKAVGFIKPYEGGKYAFAALLPKEGVSVADYLAALDGAALQKLLAEPQDATVSAALPKFETEYDTELSAVLKSMGMALPFDMDNADFSGLGSSTGGNICISRVIHKTFISVAEEGTKAGAATVVEMAEGCALIEDLKIVTLDRPFIYMLIDCETNLPFFIGTMLDPAP